MLLQLLRRPGFRRTWMPSAGALLALLLSTACSEDDIAPGGVTVPVTVEPQAVRLTVGDSTRLTTTSPVRLDARARVRWKSQQAGIVQVDSTAVPFGQAVWLRARAPGETSVYAEATSPDYPGSPAVFNVPVRVDPRP